MVKILLVIPYEAVSGYCEQMVSQIKESNIVIKQEHFYGTIHNTLEINGTDILIARGITYRALKKMMPSAHPVEIQMSGYDVSMALVECLNAYHPERIALLIPNPVQSHINSLELLCGVPIDAYDVNDESDIESALRQAAKCGTDAIVGGLTTYRRCQDLGLQAVHIKTGEKALSSALNEAVNAAHSINLERGKSNLMQAVIDSSKDVLVATDQNGIVTMANNQAYHTFHLSPAERILGRALNDLPDLPVPPDWMRVLDEGVEIDLIKRHENKYYLVNSKPIVVDGQRTGALFTVQNTENISETETKIRKELNTKGLVAKYHFGDIIGEDQSMKNCVAVAYKYSQVDSNVLLIGETGTGKELFAHSIHNTSKRSKQPFVAVNCAALPENLLESELFGYAPGAFSGASKTGKAGLFELAHRGTIFLDEIGEMPITLQAKLLRVLQEKEIRRLGDDKVIPVDVRVISATNINIHREIERGAFRSDLYYRLNLLNIRIPPLRDRKTDISLMMNYYLSKFACDFGKRVPYLTENAVNLLECHAWPGNVRELRNLCERMVVLNESGEIGVEDLRQTELSEKAPPATVQAAAEDMAHKPCPERGDLLDTLLQKRIGREELARMLGVSRTTLWRRLKELEEKERHRR